MILTPAFKLNDFICLLNFFVVFSATISHAKDASFRMIAFRTLSFIIFSDVLSHSGKKANVICQSIM